MQSSFRLMSNWFPSFYSILFLGLCSGSHAQDTGSKGLDQKLHNLSDLRTDAETKDDLEHFLQYYKTDAISMPEYQLTLTGMDEIRAYYTEIFHRQNIQYFKKLPSEIIHLGNTFVEIGTFEKEYSRLNSGDSLFTQTGKYWNIWHQQTDGSFKLKGEAFGFFHLIKNPEELTVPTNQQQPDESEVYSKKDIPFELRAYNALMEKGVKTRDGILRSKFFTDDGVIMPFADKSVSGIAEIKPYLIAYSIRGVVTIDSIMCYTYDFEYADDYIIEYDMFKVTWRVSNSTGRTEGKGIRLWKRQEDHSLKLYREIGTHNHIK